AGQAIVWRDAVNNWFAKESGVADAKGRVGRYPGRIEAESMTLAGYAAKPQTPFEIASGGQAVECAAGTAKCTASIKDSGEARWRDVVVQYFDQNKGVAHFRVFVGNQQIAEWAANDRVPSAK